MSDLSFRDCIVILATTFSKQTCSDLSSTRRAFSYFSFPTCCKSFAIAWDSMLASWFLSIFTRTREWGQNLNPMKMTPNIALKLGSVSSHKEICLFLASRIPQLVLSQMRMKLTQLPNALWFPPQILIPLSQRQKCGCKVVFLFAEKESDPNRPFLCWSVIVLDVPSKFRLMTW